MTGNDTTDSGETVLLDWSSDFDLFHTSYLEQPEKVWSQLRDSAPVAHSERWGGAWMPVRYDDISAVAHDTTHFSSRDVGVTGSNGATLLVAPPITSDPPFHQDARRLLLPAFGPKAIERLGFITQGFADELIDTFIEAGSADAAVDYAQRIPARVIGLMLGIPRSDEDRFTDWAVRVLQVGPTDHTVLREATREVLAYFGAIIEERRANPGEYQDLITDLMEAEIGGAPLTDKHILGTCFLLLLAGMDTTWSSIGSSIWHLATHPEDRARLVAEPDLIPTAVEELLRVYSPVTMARVAIAETTVGGRTVMPGERVLLAFPAGNRDPEYFDRPEEIILDRQHNRHASFGLGIHRCLGSNLARMELRIAISAWLKRIPEFTLAPDAKVIWTGGQVRGPRTIPVVF